MPLRSITLLLPAGVAYIMILLLIWDSVILWASTSLLIQGEKRVSSNKTLRYATSTKHPDGEIEHSNKVTFFKTTSALEENQIQRPPRYYHSTARRRSWIVVGPIHSQPMRLRAPNRKNGSESEVEAFSSVAALGTSPVVVNETTCGANSVLTPTCKNLLYGQTSRIVVNERRLQSMCSLSNYLNNCTHFRLSHGYDDSTITDQEKDFPLAFAIKMHTSPIQAEQLLRAIYRRHNVYCIHVDNKSESWIYEIMERISACFDNVHLVKSRESVVYASYGVIAAELKCMRACMASGTKWKYYLNLSGQEFPLRTNVEIVKILKYFKGANDIESFDLPRSQEWRYNKKHGIYGNKLYALEKQKPPFPYKIPLSKGSAYGMFARGFVDFILKDDVAQKFLGWLQDTYSPDETAWATLNTLPWAPGGYSMESRHTLNTHASRAVIWDWDYGVSCQGRHVRSVCVFGQGDLPWLSSRTNIFANKFDINFDPLALDCLEQDLKSRGTKSKIDWKYFSNLPHVIYYRNKTSTELGENYLAEQKRLWLLKNAPSKS